MTNDESRLTKCTCYVLFDIRHSVIPSSFVIRQLSFSLSRAFTLIELIVVIAVIIILAGLVLSTVGYVQKKGARSRAETEIAAISAACESYKADNSVYPRPLSTTPNSTTDALDARTMGDPVTANATLYRAASLVLYRALSGDRNLDRVVSAADESLDIDGSTLGTPLTQLPTSYYTFKPNQLSPTDGQSVPVQYIRDPFGNSYGYSTANQAAPAGGYNPTFDLWSTSGLTTNPPTDAITQQWIKNW
jgi:prepilin-type N-terminal cleavage/methylation domain-containing protein